jgi:hypothetical protein
MRTKTLLQSVADYGTLLAIELARFLLTERGIRPYPLAAPLGPAETIGPFCMFRHFITGGPYDSHPRTSLA